MTTLKTAAALALTALLLSTGLAMATSTLPHPTGPLAKPATPIVKGDDFGIGDGLDPNSLFSQTVIDRQPHLHMKSPVSCSTLWWHNEHPTGLWIKNESDKPVPAGTQLTMTVMPSGQVVVFTLWEGLAPGQTLWISDVITGDYLDDQDCDVIIS